MNTLWEWIFSVLASSAGGAALLALGAYLGRSQLSHWLSKDLEAQKAAHQRDLEAYKVTLIAEAEKVKASREVQKAMAVRIAEKKFSAIDNLHQKLTSRAVETCSALQVYSTHEHAARVKQYHVQLDKSHNASTAASLASPFMSVDEMMVIHNFIAALGTAAGKLNEANFSMTPDDLAELKKGLLAKQIECDSILKAHLSQMLNMN